MVGVKDLSRAPVGFVRTDVVVSVNDRALAVRGDGVGGPEGTVTVDHQARVPLADDEGVQQARQPPRDAARADVPGDVPGELLRRQAQRPQHARQAAPGVIAGHEKRRASVPARHLRGRRPSRGPGVALDMTESIALFRRGDVSPRSALGKTEISSPERRWRRSSRRGKTRSRLLRCYTLPPRGTAADDGRRSGRQRLRYEDFALESQDGDEQHSRRTEFVRRGQGICHDGEGSRARFGTRGGSPDVVSRDRVALGAP